MFDRRFLVIGGAFALGAIVGGAIIFALPRAAAQPVASDDARLAPRAVTGPLERGVAMTFLGDWTEGIAYTAGDVVSLKGDAYVATTDTKDTPPNGAWALLAQGGVQGPAGPQGPAGDPGAAGPQGPAGPAGNAFGTGYQVVVRALSIGAASGWYGEAVACPSTKAVVTGGWYQTSTPAAISVAGSQIIPYGSTNSLLGATYKVTLQNPTATTAKVTIYAICVTP